MLIAVAHDQEAGVVVDLAPFVEVERDRIRLRQALQLRGDLVRQHAERTVGAVDVKPQPFVAA